MIRKRRNKGRRPVRQEDSTRVNERVRAPEIRVIGADGTQLGVVTPDAGRKFAREAGLDLVEVSPNAKPPVCRIMDYGKYKFELAKKAKAAKSKQHTVKVKEIKLHPKTDVNDYNYRLKHAIDFLGKGFKVKATLVYRGREMAHLEFGRRVLDKMKGDLEEFADIESASKMEGNSMHVIFAPSKKKVANIKKVAEKSESSDKQLNTEE